MRAIYVSSYRYMCVLMLLYMCTQLAEERHRRAVLKSPTNHLSVRILLYFCPRTTTYAYTNVYVSHHTRLCVLILGYMCPHTNLCVSAYYYICVLILPYMCPQACICNYCCRSPHTTICVLMRVKGPANAYVWHYLGTGKNR